MKQVVADFLTSVPPFKGVINRLRGSGSPIFFNVPLHPLPDGESCYDPEMATGIELFSAFLDWASAHYDVMQLGEFVRQGGRQANAGKALCAITFDDGWHDTREHAFPLLRSGEMPAAVPLAVRFVEADRRLWQERLRGRMSGF